MELNVCEGKLKKLLASITRGDYQIQTLQSLISYIEHQPGTEERPSFVQSHLIEWITQAVFLWSTNQLTLSSELGAFCLNLTSALSRAEDAFTALNHNNFFIKLVNGTRARKPDVSPGVKLGYISLLASLLEHSPGIEWLMAGNFWQDVYLLCLDLELPEVSDRARGFIATFLGAVIQHDEELCNAIVQRIVKPMKRNIYDSIIFGGVVTEIPRSLKGTVTLVVHVLETFLERVLHSKKGFRVLLFFLQNLHIEEKITGFILDNNICVELAKIIFIFQFLEVYVGVLSKSVSVQELQSIVRTIKLTFIATIGKLPVEDVAFFINFGYLYFNVVGLKFSPFGVGDMKEFVQQLTIVQLMPNFCVLMKYCLTISHLETLLEDDFRNVFVQKIFKMSCQELLRMAFGLRDKVIERADIYELSTTVLHCVIKSRDSFSQEQVVIVFQALIYNLKDVMMTVKQWPDKLCLIDIGIDYFPVIFQVLALLLEEYSITWRDSFETIDVMDVCFDFLSLPTWPPKVVVAALNLVNISIKRYLTPNLALLADEAKDSTVTLWGPLLFAKLHDQIWEVRQQALDVVCTIAHIANDKFPSLQKVLLDSELPALVVKMSNSDGESFVRATAIKCLQEMIQVEKIWKDVLESEDLPQKMRNILMNETEGIVRTEAATFVGVAYEHQHFTKESLEKIYETMVHSSTTDLHWEVKDRALKFWEKVIKNHLQHQGMIDGTFPNVTFSKEHRKIVTLTDTEIRKRLRKVLTELSVIGCLGVLISAIKDDCDIEVSKTAVKITQNLGDLFKKYNLSSDNVPHSPAPTDSGAMSSTVSSVSSGVYTEDPLDLPPQSNQNEDVIDEIVNSKDVALLKNVYSPSDYGSVLNYDFQVRKIVSPDEFLLFTQQDLNNVIEEKKSWLSGIDDLESLLDDMLKTYEDSDVNSMDCY